MFKTGDKITTNKAYKEKFKNTHLNKVITGTITNPNSYLGSVEIDNKHYINPSFLEKI